MEIRYCLFRWLPALCILLHHLWSVWLDLWLSLASGECICRRTFVLFRPVAQRFGWGLSAEMQWNPRHPLVSPVRRHPVPPTPACRKSILPSKACWPVANDSTFQLHLFKVLSFHSGCGLFHCRSKICAPALQGWLRRTVDRSTRQEPCAPSLRLAKWQRYVSWVGLKMA